MKGLEGMPGADMAMAMLMAREFLERLRAEGYGLKGLPPGMETLKGVSALAWRCVRQADELADGLARHAGLPLASLDCRAGCSHCCRLNVTASPPELLIMFQAIGDLPDAVVVASGIRKAAKRIAPLADPDARLAADVPCPLLGGDGKCMVYEARPIACRTYFARSEAACAAGVEAARSGVAGTLDHFGPARIAGMVAVAGLTGTLAEAGLDPSPVDLTLGLAYLLGEGAERFLAWAGGAPMFPAGRAS